MGFFTFFKKEKDGRGKAGPETPAEAETPEGAKPEESLPENAPPPGIRAG